MRTIRTKVYKFSELSESAKQTAIEKLFDINVDYEWWESTYEDAKNAGLKITGFDIDRGSYCKGNFIEDACYTAHKIKNEHVESCETYKTAIEFLKERDELVDTAKKDENGELEDEYELDTLLDELETEFLKSILEDYRILLDKEYEYQTSKQSIIETIEANEYEFKADGKLF